MLLKNLFPKKVTMTKKIVMGRIILEESFCMEVS